VSGPIEVRLAAEQASKATLEVSVRPYAGIPGIECKHLAAHIRSVLSPIIILSQHPRTLIQLVIQSLVPQPIVQARQAFEPPLTAACINAAMLALLNASSFPLKALVCAVAVGYSPVTGQFELCPPKSVESGGCFVFMFGAEDEEEETVWTDFKTASSSDTILSQAREAARSGARVVYKSIKSSISSSSNPTRIQVDE